MSFRTYFEVTGADGSALGEQVGRQRERVADRLKDVERVVAIISGKGGVGKSHVAAALALVLAQRERVGVLDADLQSPTIARMLGARGPLPVSSEGVTAAPAGPGVRVMSMDLLLDESAPLRWSSLAGEPHTWRGVAEAGALREFLADVRWGALETLIVDMPPDAQRLEDLALLVPGLSGALAVTLPSDESRRSVARAMRAARDAQVTLLGVVENMSGYACDRCGGTRPLFPGTAGSSLAGDFAIPLLARLPFSPSGETADHAIMPVATVVRALAPRSSILARGSG